MTAVLPPEPATMTSSPTPTPTTPTTPTTPRVLQTLRTADRQVKGVLLGTLVNRLGGFLSTFLVLFLTHRGFSVAQAGLALGALGAGGLVGTLVGGTLADRFGPRCTTLVAMGGSGSLLLTILYVHDLPVLVTVVALAGAAGQLYRPAAAALLTTSTTPEQRVMTFALYRSALNIGTTVAPLLGAALIAISYDLLFWTEAGAAVVFALVAASTLPRSPAASDGSGRAGGTYRDVLADRRYLRFLIAVALNSMVYVQYISVLPIAMRAHGLPTVWFTGLVSLNALLVIVGELPATKLTQRWRPRRAVGLGLALLGLGYASYAVPLGLTAFVVGTVLWTTGEITGGPTLFAYPGLVAPPHLQARYSSALQLAFGLGTVAGPAAGLALHHVVGDAVWLVAATVALLALLLAHSGITEPGDQP